MRVPKFLLYCIGTIWILFGAMEMWDMNVEHNQLGWLFGLCLLFIGFCIIGATKEAKPPSK